MLRSFLYLDEYKLASLSAQLFEGVVEFEIRGEGGQKTQADRRGAGSANDTSEHAERTVTTKEEQRSLRDFAYTKFERALEERSLLHDIEPTTTDDHVFDRPRIIRWRGTGTLVDARVIATAAEKLPDIMQQMARRGALPPLAPDASKQQAQAHKAALQTAERAERQLVEQVVAQMKPVAALVGRFYEDRFFLQVRQDGHRQCATASLNRDWMRDSSAALQLKYGAHDTYPITLVGLVSRPPLAGPVVVPAVAPATQSIGDSIAHVVRTWHDLETMVIGPTPDQVVVDPIAAYVEFA
jgi:hypothetical protein